MIPFRCLQVKKKDAQHLLLTKSFSLNLHEFLILLFWVTLTILCFLDESKLVMLGFYRKHLPAGLVLLPTKTKLLLLVPTIMALISFIMVSIRTVWDIDRAQQKIFKKTYWLFFLKGFKKEIAFSDVLSLRLSRQNKKAPFILEWENQAGKRIFLDHAHGEKKLAGLAEEITTFTNLKLSI